MIPYHTLLSLLSDMTEDTCILTYPTCLSPISTLSKLFNLKPWIHSRHVLLITVVTREIPVGRKLLFKSLPATRIQYTASI